MSERFVTIILAIGVAFGILPSTNPNLLSAQLINTTGTATSVSDSFHEFFGVNFGFNPPNGQGPGSRVVGLNRFGQFAPGISFNQGSFQGTVPTFGGFNPATATTLNFGRRGNNGGGFNLGLTLSQGSNRQIISTSPSLTTLNGQGGTLQSGSIRPFVTGVIPVLGHRGAPTIPTTREINPSPYNGVTRALSMGNLRIGNDTSRQPVEAKPRSYTSQESSAVTPARSVAELARERKIRFAQQEQQIESMLESAKKLKDSGQPIQARILLREALALAKSQKTKVRIKELIQACRTK